MDDIINECLNEAWFDDLDPNLSDGLSAEPNVQIDVIDSGAETKCPTTNKLIKWKMPSCGGSRDSEGNSSQWVVTVNVVRPAQVTPSCSLLQFADQEQTQQVPIENGHSSPADVEMNLVEDHLIINLREILDSCSNDTTVKLFLRCQFQQLAIIDYYVCEFDIKELKVNVQVDEEEYRQHGGTTGVREKKQMVTGPHKGRCQRLERKGLKFFLETNIQLCDATQLRGIVKRVNDRPMLGKQKAVTGETEVPVAVLESIMHGANDPQAITYAYSLTADLDPDQFYIDQPGKELYTSDKTTPENNVFIFGIRLSVGNQSCKKEVYHFKTKSKEYSSNKHQYISAIELDATRAHIKDLKVQKLTTTWGDIAYSWQTLGAEHARRYEEGDVIGIFPNTRDPEETYLDLLTPHNYKEAILAGVITRSYYIAANSQEDGKPTEKICMVGKIPIKVYGSVKHGDFIYASNRLPGVAVTEEQLVADKGNWREKRLLGYSLQTNPKSDVKLVSCIVSILLSINNDQVERLLGKIEGTLSQDFERRIDEFRDDVDIKMDGMNQIVSTTQEYVATKRREISRKTCRVCSLIVLFFVLAILSCFFFLSPKSPYIVWKCRRGSLSGSVTFRIDNGNDEKYIRMEGILFDVSELREKIGVKFPRKKNFTGSYYLNLRKCKRENLRKVLGWFSNPPVYTRTQVFAVLCNCSSIFHYHYHHDNSWLPYKHIFSPTCHGDKASICDETITGEHG